MPAGVVQGAEGMEKEINGLREARDKAKEEVTKAEHKTQAALHGMDSAGQLLERLEKGGKEAPFPARGIRELYCSGIFRVTECS
ncbi:MAG: hypothetical protein ACOX1G_03160 [bacterium]